MSTRGVLGYPPAAVKKAWIALALAGLAAAGFVLLRPAKPSSPAAAEPSFDALPLPQLMDKLKWNLPEDEYEILLQAFVKRGRPAADALLAASRAAKDAPWDPALPALARIRRDAPDPALREEVDRFLRDVFPMKIHIVRTISDEEGAREAALARANPGEMVEYHFNPMGSRTVGEEDVEVHSLGGLVDLLAEDNAQALDHLTYRFASEFIHRFGDDADAELRKAAIGHGPAKGAALALVRIHRAKAAPFLVELLKDPREGRRKASVRAFAALEGDGPEAFPLLVALLGDPQHRDAARDAIYAQDMYLGGPEPARLLLDVLARCDAEGRIAVMEILRRLPVPEEVPLDAVAALTKDPDPQVAYWAEQTLSSLRPTPPPTEP